MNDKLTRFVLSLCAIASVACSQAFAQPSAVTITEVVDVAGTTTNFGLILGAGVVAVLGLKLAIAAANKLVGFLMGGKRTQA